MAEGVGEDDVAARFGQVDRRVVAQLVLGNVVLDHVLILGQAQVLDHVHEAVQVNLVVADVLVVEQDQAHLDGVLGDLGGRGAGEHADQNQGQNQSQRNQFLHDDSILL